MTNTHTIDAKGKKLGRVATEAAVILMGKTTPDFVKNKTSPVKVTITNASKAAISEKKLDEKIYRTYSGYPGGLKTKTMRQVTQKLGYSEIFQDAIYGMLPNNKLRKPRMKNLTITE